MAFSPTYNLRRGQGRGRGGWRGIHRPTFTNPTPQLPKPVATQSKLGVISQVSIDEPVNVPSLKITETAYVASYNWVDGQGADILIPGNPPKWQPLAESKHLKEDSGVYYRDPNAARFPSFPIEPAVRAILHQEPDETVFDVDVFGCGSTLGSLLSFVRHEDRTFRFGIELIGKTAIFVRKTNEPRETINDVRGYGHSFAEAYTAWDRSVKGSASHQRIISYTFGKLRFLVRSECDGYFPEAAGQVNNQAADPGTVSSDHAETVDVTLSSLFVQAPMSRQSGFLDIRSAGSLVAQSTIFDLKTRSSFGKDKTSVSNFLQRLWVNQTPRLVLAFHERGRFKPSDIQVHHVTQALKDWEVHHSEDLAQYREILLKLIRLCQERRRLEIRRIGTGPIEIWTEVRGWAALPRDLRALWRNNGNVELDAPENEDADLDTADGGADIAESTIDEGTDDSGSDIDEGDNAEYLRY